MAKDQLGISRLRLQYKTRLNHKHKRTKPEPRAHYPFFLKSLSDGVWVRGKGAGLSVPFPADVTAKSESSIGAS